METYKPVNSNKSYRKKHFKRITNATNEINDGKKNQVPVSSVKKKAPESLDFHDCESMMYRKVILIELFIFFLYSFLI